MTRFALSSHVGGTLLLAAISAAWAKGATAPANPCTLLPPATVSQALGAAYGTPQSSVAPRPFANTVEGTDCSYSAQGTRGQLLFRIYFDPSAGDATSLFARLKMFYGPPTAAAVGDEAYFDGKGALHVRKGNVRYYLESRGSKTASLNALGLSVAGQL